MDAFQQELMRRSPLAACVLDVSDFIFDERLLNSIWARHRGRCYEDVLGFEDFLRLMRDALIHHGGSAHALFIELERDGVQPVDESNFYRKLARTPVELSRALLRECSGRLAELMPAGTDVGADAGAKLPGCFDGFEVIVGDGKAIKNAAKRLAPTRGYSGRLIGAKALVAMNVRSGMAVAMSDSLDGMANDVREGLRPPLPLVPALMDQLREVIARPILSVWDRQFDDVRTLGRLSSREGDAFVVRLKQKNHAFAVESAVERRDAQGRAVRDETGMLGKGNNAMRVRRITLERDGAGAGAGASEEDVVLLTNLLDRAAYGAGDILQLYKTRWTIEQVFQQVTETFALEHLIGSSPKAVLFQFAYCLLLYNLVQLIKTYVAADGRVLATIVSTFYLFADIRRELLAWAYHTDGTWPRRRRDAEQMRQRLRELLHGSWDPIGYTKASDKKPRPIRPPPKRLRGGHSSVQRLLEGRARVIR